ncbi:hypothetical protein F5Y04DRAFT_247119 [Hypomontagnella monticulosa]|nr:hypothetical protein F5Y04DRAFT_247119 [Hypomontagnella monticulosa]
MQLTSIFAAAGLAVVTSNALLLPPDIAESDNDMVTTLPIAVEADVSIPKIAEAQHLKLKCPGCPVRIPHHGKVKVVNSIPSHLELDFSIEPSDNADRLMLNGYELYPRADPFQNQRILTAAVRPDFTDRRMKRPHHFKGPQPQAIQPLGFGLQTGTTPSEDEKEALELVELELDIIEVGDVFVSGIPNVQLSMVKTPTGKLMIADIKTVESDTESNPMDKQKECTTLICKWKAVIMDKLAGLRNYKGCGGSRRPHPKVDENKTEESKAIESEDNKSAWNPHWNGENGHHQKNWGLLFRNIASHILLPIAIGILAGVTSCLLGMLAGTFVVFLWRMATRRGCRRHHKRTHHHKASHAEAIIADEKAGLMAYEEEEVAPLEGQDVVVLDKKTDNVA